MAGDVALLALSGLVVVPGFAALPGSGAIPGLAADSRALAISVLCIVDIVAGLVAVAVPVLCGRTGVAAGAVGARGGRLASIPTRAARRESTTRRQLIAAHWFCDRDVRKPPGASNMLKIALSTTVKRHSSGSAWIPAAACFIARSKLVVPTCVMT